MRVNLKSVQFDLEKSKFYYIIDFRKLDIIDCDYSALKVRLTDDCFAKFTEFFGGLSLFPKSNGFRIIDARDNGVMVDIHAQYSAQYSATDEGSLFKTYSISVILVTKDKTEIISYDTGVTVPELYTIFRDLMIQTSDKLITESRSRFANFEQNEIIMRINDALPIKFDKLSENDRKDILGTMKGVNIFYDDLTKPEKDKEEAPKLISVDTIPGDHNSDGNYVTVDVRLLVNVPTQLHDIAIKMLEEFALNAQQKCSMMRNLYRICPEDKKDDLIQYLTYNSAFRGSELDGHNFLDEDNYFSDLKWLKERKG